MFTKWSKHIKGEIILDLVFENKLTECEWQMHISNPPKCENLVLTVWPVNVLIGLSTPNLHTCMHWSVEQDAKLVFVCQSTSSAGAEKHKILCDLL